MYFTFPKEKTYSDLWINACGRGDEINIKNAVICSIHFQKQDYNDDLKARLLGIESPKNVRKLRRDAVPSLHLPHGKCDNCIIICATTV